MKDNVKHIHAFDRNYHFSEEVKLPMRVKWRFKTISKDIPISQPIVRGNHLWVLGPFNKTGKPYSPVMVYEIDAATGEKIWEYRIDQQFGWVSKNCCYKDQFITATNEDIIGLQDGEISFRAEKVNLQTDSIVTDDEYIYFSRKDGIAKLDSTGAVVEKLEVQRPSALTLADGRIFYGAANSLYCISAIKMEVLWETDLADIGRYYDKIKSRRQKKEIYSSGKLRGRYAVLSDGKMFCNVGRNIICLDAEDGHFLWKGDATGDPVYIGNRLYAFDKVGNFYCLNAHTGEQLFKTRQTNIHGLYVSVPFVSGSIFFIGGIGIMAFDICDGSLSWDYQAKKKGSIFFDPVYIDGHLYVGSEDGYLYCFAGD